MTVVTKNKIKLIATTVLIGMAFAIFRSYLKNSSFLFNPNQRYSDMFAMIEICNSNNPYFTTIPFSSNYFPVANLIFYVFSIITNKTILLLSFFGIFLYFYYKTLQKYFDTKSRLLSFELTAIFIMSYPIIYVFDRMNIEIYNFLFCLLFFYFKENSHPRLAQLFLALSISMKLFTGVFLILYLKEKKYKEIFYIAILSLGLNTVLLATYPGGLIENLYGLLNALKNFSVTYSVLTMHIHYGISLYGMLHYFYFELFKIEDALPKNINLAYTFFTIYSFLFTSWFILKRNMTQWKVIFLLTSLLLILPTVSYDYKLLFVLLPLLFYLKSEENSCFYSICFALLLIPNDYIYLHGDISIAVIINPLIILTMFLRILFERKEIKLI